MSNQSKDNFQVFIALPSGDVCTVRGLYGQMFVYELKSRVELKAGIPGDIFCFFFMNVQLEDKEKLKSYNLKNGCIVRIKIESSWMGLFEACWKGDLYDVFENGVQFLDEGDFQDYDISLWNKLVIQRATFALFIACHRGYLGLILELINRGASNINGKTIFGRSALHAAAYQGFVGCVALLLSEGAVPNQIDIQGKTPLTLASENGHVYCERRLWLYQLNLPTSVRPSTSCSVGSGEGSDGGRPNKGYYVPAVKLPSADRGTKEQSDLNNNHSNEQDKTERIHFPAPRFTTNDAKKQPRRLTNSANHEPPDSTPKPFTLMQIAEKYRKELRDYNDGTLNLPSDKENRLPAEKGRLEQEAQAPDQKVPSSKGEAVEESTTLIGAEKEGLERTNSKSAETNEVSRQKRKGLKERSDWDRKQQARDENDSAGDIGKQNQERLASRRTNGIRKLDVLMAESRVESERLNVASSPQEQKGKTFDRSTSENAPEQEREISLVDTGQEYCCRKPAQTFENWLKMKRDQEKNRPSTAPAQKSKFGKSIDPESFKKWLTSKRHQRAHLNAESSSTTKKTFITAGGMTFDRWLESKLVNRPSSALNNATPPSRETSPGVNKVRKPVISGKPFELWLAEKREMEQSAHTEKDEEKGKSYSRSGKTFKVWLQDKTKQKQIELVQKITTLKEQQRLAELDQLQRWLNPRYKTFEDWVALKNHQAMLERVRENAQNDSKRQQINFPADEKQKDSKVVYDIWQTMKALQELSDEETKYNEMKAIWAAKEKEKAQLRRLNIIDKTRRFNVKSST